MAKAPPIPQGRAEFMSPEEAEREAKRLGILTWTPQPGPQTEALLRKEFEILFGGAKMGGKSFLAIGWLIKGNQEVPAEKCKPIDVTYLNSKHYRALALRRTHDELRDWIDQADEYYRACGGVLDKSTLEWTWPSGAKISTGHLNDESAYWKYAGKRVIRLFIDEVTNIPKFSLYDRLVSCVRSNVEGMRPQILLATNPEGPGLGWVEKRFVDVLGPDGKVVIPGTTICEKSYNPVLKKEVERTRVFISSKITDNVRGMKADPTYYSRLEAMEEPLRSAYLYGDWKASRGLFFKDFRPKGPRRVADQLVEPPEANHVVESSATPLLYWWPRFMSMDWGYDHYACVLKHCAHPSKQLHTYDEMVARELTGEEWGEKIAYFAADDLRQLPTHAMVLYLSPDCFGNKRGSEKDISEQIQSGINRVLGPNSAVLLTEDEMGEDDFFRRLALQKESRIVIRKADNKRRDGWAYMRELLRWRRAENPDKKKIDWPYATSLLESEGTIRYFEYLRQFEEKAPEPLPKWQIHAKCVELIQALQDVAADPNDTEDIIDTGAKANDVSDCARYGSMAYKHTLAKMPLEPFADKRVAEALAQDPTLNLERQFQIRQHANWEFKNSTFGGRPFVVDRRGMASQRVRVL